MARLVKIVEVPNPALWDQIHGAKGNRQGVVSLWGCTAATSSAQEKRRVVAHLEIRFELYKHRCQQSMHHCQAIAELSK